MSGLVVRTAAGDADRAACFAIRVAVFVNEQGVAMREELDTHDATATHLLAVMDGRPVGTLRWRVLPGATAKIERVAVLREARGLGLGRVLMRQALERIAAAGPGSIVLNAQTAAADFYRQLGFVAEGLPFDEAGIEHVRMRLDTTVSASGRTDVTP
jgi:predicted GNAT family N-acyltransferase